MDEINELKSEIEWLKELLARAMNAIEVHGPLEYEDEVAIRAALVQRAAP